MHKMRQENDILKRQMKEYELGAMKYQEEYQKQQNKKRKKLKKKFKPIPYDRLFSMNDPRFGLPQQFRKHVEQYFDEDGNILSENDSYESETSFEKRMKLREEQDQQ